MVTSSKTDSTRERYRGLFPDWGSKRIVVVNCLKDTFSVAADTNYPEKHNYSHVLENAEQKTHPKLNAFQSVSIAGCDLMSSCLYTAGVCAGYGGKVRVVKHSITYKGNIDIIIVRWHHWD